jgi:hypothetical protein
MMAGAGLLASTVTGRGKPAEACLSNSLIRIAQKAGCMMVQSP